MQQVAEAHVAIEGAATSKPENVAEERPQSLGGRIVEEAGIQFVTEAIGAMVKGAPEVAADCVGAVAGAVAEGVGSL